MLKKLSQESIRTILETGIAEFAQSGSDKASMSAIARKSGVSVGVIYKYFENKDTFFIACLRHALTALEEAIDEAMSGEARLLIRAEKLIRALQKSAKTQRDYHVLYHEITAGSCRKYAPMLAREIEGISAKAYTAYIASAQKRGEVRSDMSPRLFAFFFDNLLMMLQFSYCCDYYRARFRIYCGDEIFDADEKIVAELLKFLESAFTTEHAQIPHNI